MNDFRPGFRMSWFDAAVLLVGAILAWLVGDRMAIGGLLVGFVVGHFFLFCNVFRIARNSELLWAGVFLSLAVSTVLCQAQGWWVTIPVSLVLSTFLIWLEMRKPSYHGIGWQRINPNLETWWKDHRRV